MSSSETQLTDEQLDEHISAYEAKLAPKTGISRQRLLVTLMVIAALAWLAWPWQDELAFHFSNKEPIDLGDAVGVMERLPKGPNAYVRLQGILSNKAATVSGLRPGSLRMGPVQVRRLLGASIFVEFDQDTFLDRYQMFTQIDVQGRLQDFGPDSELAPAYYYFKERLKMKFPPNAKVLIVDERPGEMWRYPIGVAFCLVLIMFSILSLLRTAQRRHTSHEEMVAEE